jgi:hypothetical protein
MFLTEIKCNIIPKFCWYYNNGNLTCDHIHEITPIFKVNIKNIFVYSENEFVKIIKIPSNKYHPNCDPKNGNLCNLDWLINKKIKKNDIIEITKALSHYHFTSYFKYCKDIKILLTRFSLKEEKNIIIKLNLKEKKNGR